MILVGNPGDSAEAGRLQFGRRANGSIRLPNGPIFANLTEMNNWLLDHPKYYAANRNYVNQLLKHYPKLVNSRPEWMDFFHSAGVGDDPYQDPKVDPSDSARLFPRKGPAAPKVTPKPPKDKRVPSGGGGTGSMPLDLGGGDVAKVLATILTQAKQLSNQQVAPTLTEGMLDKYFANQDPMERATTAADMAYKGTIDSLSKRLSQLDSGSTDGIFSDLDKFYGMVDQSVSDAKAADAETLAQNSGELGDMTQAFMAAAGGAAQPGNASVAQQGVISDAALRGMGQAQSNFQSNMGNFFAQANAAQKSQIRRDIESQRSDLADQLAQAQAERSLYQSQQFTDFSDKNAGLQLDLMNQLYGQRKDASDTAWNRLLGLANLTGMASTIPQQVQQGNLNTAKGIEDWKRSIILGQQERAQLKQFQDQYGGGEQFPFKNLDPGTRAKLAGQLQANLLGEMGYLTVNPKQFLSTLRNRLYNVAGYERTPQTEAFIQSLLEPKLINWWNKYHPGHKYNG